MHVFTDEKTGAPCVEINTCAPKKMQAYFRTLTFAMGTTIPKVYREMAGRFLKEKPWKHGLQWRTTQEQAGIHGVHGERYSASPFWTPVSIRLPVILGKELESLADQQEVPLSSVGYTMLYWWTWWIYRPGNGRVQALKGNIPFILYKLFLPLVDKKDPRLLIKVRAPARMKRHHNTVSFPTDRILQAILLKSAEYFLEEKPWEQGLQWKSEGGFETVFKNYAVEENAAGWKQVQVRLPAEISYSLKDLAMKQSVPLSSVIHSMLCFASKNDEA